MASALHNLSQYDETNIPSAKGMRIGLVLSNWNSEITHKLYEACVETLLKHQAKQEDLHTIQVPGSFELPMGARLLLQNKKLDAVICIGCVIKGDTPHNHYINQSVAQGITSLSLTTGTPVIFGLLTPDTPSQAQERAGGVHGNKGVEAAVTAIRMVELKSSLSEKKKIGF